MTENLQPKPEGEVPVDFDDMTDDELMGGLEELSGEGRREIESTLETSPHTDNAQKLGNLGAITDDELDDAVNELDDGDGIKSILETPQTDSLKYETKTPGAPVMVFTRFSKCSTEGLLMRE